MQHTPCKQKSPLISGGFDIYNLQSFTLTLAYVILSLFQG
ncbi:uncharacterized protein METZ01_LOCUS476204, partial [marine metagenome]